MANRLNMAVHASIHALFLKGFSQRRIAFELNVDRATVARSIRQLTRDPNTAIAPTGSNEPRQASNAAIAPTGSEPSRHVEPTSESTAPHSSDSHALTPHATSEPIASPTPSLGDDVAIPRSSIPSAGRRSACRPWLHVIAPMLEAGLSAQRVYQDLVAEHGYSGSYYSVRRFVRRLDASIDPPFRRIETEPGVEAQVDFGTGAPIVGSDGKRRKTHVFRVVLGFSRKAYSIAVRKQTTENFILCLENAFYHFGGVPKTIVLDNLKAAVTKADWFEPEINPKVRAFAEHYGVVLLPTRPYHPRHKGKVENGIGYIKNNALKGRRFASLEEENDFLLHWERTVADVRIHGTTRKQVARLFEDFERPRLQTLPPDRFPFYHEQKRIVHGDGHVEVAKSYYSAPPEYQGREVWVRWDSHSVYIYNMRMERIGVHARQAPGEFSTRSGDIASEKISGVERGAAHHLARASRIGPGAKRWAEEVIGTRGVEAVRVLMGLLSLTRRFEWSAIDAACEIASRSKEFRLRTIRRLIERGAGTRQEEFTFTQEHQIIRNLSEYQQFVHEAFQKGD